jgi:hypothetical protein
METAELSSASSWLHWLSVIKYVGGGMVVIGVAAELLGDWFSEPLQKKLEDARKLEIAQLTTEGQRLSKEAEIARAAIADANARAAEATRQAAQAQLALEKFKQPRAIPDLRAFGARLKRFAKTRFDMSVIPGDPEAAVLMSHIAASLEEAEWTWVEYNPPGGKLMMVFNIPGKPNVGQEGWRAVSIQVPDERTTELSAAADALAGELVAIGIEVTRDKALATIPNKDTLHILVGKKPT